MHSILEPGQFDRPALGPRLGTLERGPRFPISGAPAWQSNRTPTGARALDIPIPEVHGTLKKVHLVGVFALMEGREPEPIGTIGAHVMLLQNDRIAYRHDLQRERHYDDASCLEPRKTIAGDGSSIETVGRVDLVDRPVRIDVMTLDLDQISADTLRFRELGTAATFHIHDVFFEFEPAAGCPFRASSGRVPLSEVGTIIRIGDRVKFTAAVDQLEEGLMTAQDLDEARSLALTFMAVASVALLEMGASQIGRAHV